MVLKYGSDIIHSIFHQCFFGKFKQYMWCMYGRKCYLYICFFYIEYVYQYE